MCRRPFFGWMCLSREAGFHAILNVHADGERDDVQVFARRLLGTGLAVSVHVAVPAACPLSRLKSYGQMRLYVLQLTQPLYQDEVYPDSGATAISDAIGNYRKQELLCSKYDWGETA